VVISPKSPISPNSPRGDIWGYSFSKLAPLVDFYLIISDLVLCVDAVYLQRGCLQTTHVRQPLRGRSRVVHSRHTAIINLAFVGIAPVIAAMLILWVGVSFFLLLEKNE
jgi:hypothetical protein